MKVIVAGSKGYSKYDVFKRALAAVLEDMKEDEDKSFYIYGLGPNEINSFGQEFSNITENYLKSHGISISFFRMPEREALRRIFDNSINRVLYFGKSEAHNNIVKAAQAADVDVHVYKY